MKKKEDIKSIKKVSISNSPKLDAVNPIPFESERTWSFSNNSAYLPFLTGNDNFAQILLESRLLSVTHGACIETKSEFCAGNEFINLDNADSKLDKAFSDWLNTINRKNHSAIALNKKIFESHFQWGNTPIEVVRYSFKNQRFLSVYIHSFLEWRLCPPDEDDILTHAVQSKMFLKRQTITVEALKGAKRLPLYSPLNSNRQNWKKFNDGTERTLIWYKNEYQGYANYGMPSSVNSLIYQILEYKGARYNMDGFDNDWVASAVLHLKGVVSAPEIKEIAKNIISTHTGDGRRGRVAVIGSEAGMTEGSEFHTIDTKKDGSFIESDKAWMEKIIFANGWDAILAGLVSPSTLGKGEGFISKIYEIKQKTVIIPAQTKLINGVWNPIFNIAREWLGLNIPENIGIKSSANISSLSDVDVTPVVTVNEVREANNLPKILGEKGDMLIGELNASQKPKEEKPKTNGNV